MSTAPRKLGRRSAIRNGALGLTGATMLPREASAGPAVCPPSAPEVAPIRTGFDRLDADGFHALKGRRVGLIANPTSVDRRLVHIADRLHNSSDANLVAIFGPEHGFRGSAEAGHSEARTTDPRTGITVYDIYQASGDRLDAVIRQSGVDLILFDIQDIGARFYTYIWTLFDAMVSAARLGIEIMVLDRPNPITGHEGSGPLLNPQFASFVGRVPILLRHGLTVGELAGLFNGLHVPRHAGRPARLSVVGMQGWRRNMFLDQTDLVWVPPSPNMPTVTTALAYPGTCLFEGVTLSVGRGTSSPFLMLGGPDWDAERWVNELMDANLPGCLFREAWFRPGSDVVQGQLCHGLQLAITDRKTFDPLLTGIRMLHAGYHLAPNTFWRGTGATVDSLYGSNALRNMLARGASVQDIIGSWKAGEASFNQQRKAFLLY